MLKKDILDNQFIIFLLFIGISLINIIASIHFTTLMLAGILLIAFIKTMENKYYYSLFWIILGFLLVENIQGFHSFSLVSLSLIIYIVIKPNIEHIFSSSDILKNIYIIIFYIGIVCLYGFFNGIDTFLISKIFINLIIDIVIVGLFI